MAHSKRSLLRLLGFSVLWIAFALASLAGVTVSGLDYLLQGMEHSAGEHPTLIELFWKAVWPFACIGLVLLLSHLRLRRMKSILLAVVATGGTVWWSIEAFPGISVEESLRERIPTILLGCIVVGGVLRLTAPKAGQTRTL